MYTKKTNFSLKASSKYFIQKSYLAAKKVEELLVILLILKQEIIEGISLAV